MTFYSLTYFFGNSWDSPSFFSSVPKVFSSKKVQWPDTLSVSFSVIAQRYWTVYSSLLLFSLETNGVEAPDHRTLSKEDTHATVE